MRLGTLAPSIKSGKGNQAKRREQAHQLSPSYPSSPIGAGSHRRNMMTPHGRTDASTLWWILFLPTAETTVDILSDWATQVSSTCGDTTRPRAATELLPGSVYLWKLPHSLIVNHGRTQRGLRCRVLCVLLIRFQVVVQGSGDLEATRVSSFLLLLQDLSR